MDVFANMLYQGCNYLHDMGWLLKGENQQRQWRLWLHGKKYESNHSQ